MLKPTTRNIVVLFLCCFFLSLAFRLYALRDNVPQADEIHWEKRSAGLLEKLRTGQYAEFSTHMTHPGLVPGFIMASGQLLAEKYNAARGFAEDGPKAIQPLHASRIACAFVSSLLAPLLFLLTFRLLGLEFAFLAAALFALDPHNIGLSRQAHLDAVLSLLVCITLFSYLRGVERQSVFWKLCAGVFWGLSIATKPTAIALPFVFLIFNFFRRFTRPRAERAGLAIVSYADIAAIIVGHFVLAALYTRFWVHESEYMIRLGVLSELADKLYLLGLFFRAHVVLSGGLALVALAAIAVASRISNYAKHLRALASAFVLFLGTLYFVPQVLENIVRFWVWVTRLSGENHRAYGISWEAPKFGYFSLYSGELPTLVFFAALIGILAFIFHLRKTQSDRKLNDLLGMSLVAIIVWTGILSISDKQTFRYVMPVVPLVYILAAFGFKAFIESLQVLSNRALSNRTLSNRARFSFSYFAVPLLFLIHFVSALSWWPNYNLFFNYVSGGLPAAVELDRGLAIAGATEALSFLQQQEGFGEDDSVWVVLGCDGDVFRYQNKNLFPSNDRLKFLNREDAAADFLLVTPQFIERLSPEPIQEFITPEPVYKYDFKGATLVSVFRAPERKHTSNESIYFRQAAHIRRAVGRDIRSTSPLQLRVQEQRLSLQNVVEAVPSRDERGYVMLGEYVRLEPGEYRAEFFLRRAVSEAVAAELGPERYALRVEFGRCKQIVTLGELAEGDFSVSSLSCDFDRSLRPQIRAYWFGNVPIEIAGIRIRAAEGGGHDQVVSATVR